MKTHTTPTGIELLMPQIPKEGEVLEFTQNFLYYKEGCIQHGINLMHPPTNGTILGTYHEDEHMYYTEFWPECDIEGIGFEGAEDFSNWLRSEGITIDEGFKRVIIKKN